MNSYKFNSHARSWVSTAMKHFFNISYLDVFKHFRSVDKINDNYVFSTQEGDKYKLIFEKIEDE